LWSHASAAETHYVSLSGGNIPPYTNWATAAVRIQDAVSVASSGSVVLVAAGTYAEGGSPIPGYGLLNRVALTEAIRVESVDGPQATVIEGSGDPATRGVYLTSGSELVGFTVRGGRTLSSGVFPFEQNGGGVYLSHGGSVSNCVIEQSEGTEGGGVYILGGGRVSFSTITGNYARAGGGGVRFSDAGSGVVEHSRIVGNSTAGEAGGVHIYHTGRLRSCLIAGNVAAVRSGAVYVDWGTYGSGAHIENCTMAGNAAPVHGGLHYVIAGASVRNSIIWGNANGNWSGGSYEYCLTTPLPSGTGNLADAPQFADGNYRLATGSPGIDGGSVAFVTTSVDLDNQPRVTGVSVDMGAYETVGGSGVMVSAPDTPTGSEVATSGMVEDYQATGSVSSDGSGVEYRFDWGDGSFSEWSASGTDSKFWGAGVYVVRAKARSAANPWSESGWSAGLTVTVTNPPVEIRTHYVSLSGGNIPPYTNWATAAVRIQDAIDSAHDGDRVIVDNGTFNERIDFGGRDIEVVSRFDSSGDPEDVERTMINGDGQGRVVTFQNGESGAALLRGFTIANGSTMGAAWPHAHGGGIGCMEASPRLQDLLLIDNITLHEGGAIYLAHSTSSLQRIRILNNMAHGNSGAIRISYGNPSLEQIEMRGNTGVQGAGAMLIYHSSPLMRNLLIASNSTEGVGGGLFLDAANPVIENATIAHNQAPPGGGGGLNISYMSKPVLKNAIVWGNTAEQIVYEARWFGMELTVTYSDIQDGLAGILTRGRGPVHWLDGNLNQNPQFASEQDFRLTSISPCLNAGKDEAWMVKSVDLAGKARLNGAVDMGCYEFTEEPGVAHGVLTVIIKPDDVIPLGAMWKLNTGLVTNWLMSGEEISVPAGTYSIVARDQAGWLRPSNLDVEVTPFSNGKHEMVYQRLFDDETPPVIVSITPGNGYVSQHHEISMTIEAVDNIGIVSVTVNGQPANAMGENRYEAVLSNIRGSLNRIEVAARDFLGNTAREDVIYNQAARISLTAIWDGYWRVRNPNAGEIMFTWDVVENPVESGFGIAGANADTFFTNGVGPKTVRLYVGGELVDTKVSSALPPQDVNTDVNLVDSDLDGYSNMEEELAGTDPNDPDSFFAIRGGVENISSLGKPDFKPRDSEPVFGAGMVYTWHGSVDSAYSIETSTNMASWIGLPAFTRIPGTGTWMSYTNAGDAASPIFMRIRAEKR
jgi:hypothetical protein